jgi:hypothetical protein
MITAGTSWMFANNDDTGPLSALAPYADELPPAEAGVAGGTVTDVE